MTTAIKTNNYDYVSTKETYNVNITLLDDFTVAIKAVEKSTKKVYIQDRIDNQQMIFELLENAFLFRNEYKINKFVIDITNELVIKISYPHPTHFKRRRFICFNLEYQEPKEEPVSEPEPEPEPEAEPEPDPEPKKVSPRISRRKLREKNEGRKRKRVIVM